MTIANALNSLNSVNGKTIACLENFQTFTKAQAVASVALTSSAGNVATDASLSNTFTLTLTENITLSNPTNLVSGTRYTWVITQGAGSYTVALGGAFLSTLDVFVMPAGAGDKAMLEAIYDGTNLIYTFDLHAASDFVLQNDVFVAKNGVNVPGGGNVSSPYGDPFYATTQTTGSSSNPHMINISPGTYSTASMTIKPYIGYIAPLPFGVIDVTDAITLDVSWSSTTNGAIAAFTNIEFTGIGGINLNLSALTATPLLMTFTDCVINSEFTFTGHLTNTSIFIAKETDFFSTFTAVNATVEIKNSFVSSDCQISGTSLLHSFEAIESDFSSTVELQCINALFYGCELSHNDVDPALSILPAGSGSVGNDVKIKNSAISGSILISGASSRVSAVSITNSSTNTITLDTTNCTLFIDLTSYPVAGFSFTNGATSDQITVFRGDAATDFSPDNTVFVAANGSNVTGTGELLNPYADPFYASTQTTGTPTSQKLIIMYPGDDEYGGLLVVKPNITYQGYQYTTRIDLSGTVTLDPSWSTSGIGSISGFKDIFFIGGTIDFDFSAAGAGRGFIFESCYVSTVTLTGASGNIPSVLMNNCSFANDLIVESVNLEAYSLRFDGSDADITIQSGGSGNTTVDLSGCYFNSGTDILISGASGSTSAVRLFSSPIRGTLTLDTTFSTLVIDASSIPAGGITYTNGATSSQVTIVGSAPSKLFNNAYTGQNYIVPVAQNSSANATAWNLNTASSAKQTMTENTTLSAPSNQVEGGIYTFKFVQDSTPRTLAFNSVYKFPGGVVPVVSTGNGAVDIFTFYSDGTNMRCIGIAQNIS